MSFAEHLAGVVSEKRGGRSHRESLAQKWTDHECKLLDKAFELFKEHCVQEAEQARCEATVSLWRLSQKIEDFPKHSPEDSAKLFFFDGVGAECWFYAEHGVMSTFSAEAAHIGLSEVLRGMFPKFVDRILSCGFARWCHEAGTLKVRVSWDVPAVTPRSFAAHLAEVLGEKKAQHLERESKAQKWADHECKLLDKAVEVFKEHCVHEAEQERCEASLSFWELSQKIEDFPKHSLEDSVRAVHSWGDGAGADCWFYARRGVMATFSAETPISFAEVLRGMMPRFVDRVKAHGLARCSQEAGTWNVRACWGAIAEEEERAEQGRPGKRLKLQPAEVLAAGGA